MSNQEWFGLGENQGKMYQSYRASSTDEYSLNKKLE
jgi:hypothetical protein